MTTFLGMPGYGKQTAEAGRGFWRARRDMSQVVAEYRSGSLLAANFNHLWCSALNLAHRGERVDYFAMQHDDIGPEEFWLDTLVEELENRELDLLGVVVPIKDSRGLTSLALDEPGETWRPRCRLSMRDVYRLPATFTSEDVGAPLLLNTGCWVCRFNPEWARKVRFTINDRIVFNKATDRYEAQVESEDWYFSRLCHEMGLRIGATRKIRVMHSGETDFPNNVPWGDPYDWAFLKQSPIPEPPPGAFRFPHDVDGWLTEDEGLALAELARGRDVLEFGSYCGRSTICLAQTASHVTSVDPHDGSGTPLPRDTRLEFDANLSRYGVAERVVSLLPGEPLPRERYGLAFIDGAHDFDSVMADALLAASVLVPGGLLAFHDYASPVDPGVTRAVDEIVASGGEILSTHNMLAVVRPPAALLTEAF